LNKHEYSIGKKNPFLYYELLTNYPLGKPRLCGGLAKTLDSCFRRNDGKKKTLTIDWAMTVWF